MQTARHFVGILVKFSPRVQLGHDDFRRRASFFCNQPGRNTPTIVHYRHRLVGVYRHGNFFAVASECFVYGVVDHLKNHMMKASTVIGVTDIHAGSFADRFQPLKDLNTAFVVDRLNAHKYSSWRAFIISRTGVTGPEKRLFLVDFCGFT